MPNRAFKQAEAEFFRIVTSDQIKPAYFHDGFSGESLLVSDHANRRTEPHMPVAMSSEPEFAAAMIAAHRHEPSLHEFRGNAQYSKVGVGAPTAPQ
jgi:hypothetical protein